MYEQDEVIPLPEPEPSFPSMPVYQAPMPQQESIIEADTIRAGNVVSGHQYIGQQQIYQVAGNLTHTPLHTRSFRPFMAAELPADFVPRPNEFGVLKKRLLQGPREHPTAITTALLGAGGYGKTTLALALCHDSDIQSAFSDGILWVTLGDQPTNLVGKIEDLVYILFGERPGFTSIDAAVSELRNALSDKAYLLVLDDVWRFSDLKPFLQGGLHCSRLITTRNDQVLPGTVTRFAVDAMQTDEAIHLLQAGLLIQIGIPETQIMRQLAVSLGEWPLLLTLANGVLRERVERLREPLTTALYFLQRALEKRGVLAFDTKNAHERNEAVERTVEVSLSQLDREDRKRFVELVIFPEDIPIPQVTVQRLWQATGGLDELDTEELCSQLFRLSLLVAYSLSLPLPFLRLHDVIRGYLQVKTSEQVRTFHEQLLDTYQCKHWADLALDEPYLWDHLVEHLLGARRTMTLLDTMKDLRYLATKTLLRGAAAMERDLIQTLTQTSLDDVVVTLHQQFRRIAHLLARGQTLRDVEETLIIRLTQVQRLEAACEALRQTMKPPWLMAWHPLPDLNTPFLVRVLQEHTKRVTSCAVGPDGTWLASGFQDGTLKLWDVATDTEWLTLQGHTEAVTSCAVSPDGAWFASTSRDGTFKLWDVHQGSCLATFSSEGGLTSCAFHPDGKHLIVAGGSGIFFLDVVW